jgi:hypothetical protein
MLDLFSQKVYAALPGETGGFDSLFKNIKEQIISPIIYFLIALAVVYFLWGMVVFIQNADNADKRKEGYDHMIYGIIGIFIMISVNGIIALITATIGGI